MYIPKLKLIYYFFSILLLCVPKINSKKPPVTLSYQGIKDGKGWSKAMWKDEIEKV